MTLMGRYSNVVLLLYEQLFYCVTCPSHAVSISLLLRCCLLLKYIALLVLHVLLKHSSVCASCFVGSSYNGKPTSLLKLFLLLLGGWLVDLMVTTFFLSFFFFTVFSEGIPFCLSYILTIFYVWSSRSSHMASKAISLLLPKRVTVDKIVS